MDSAIEGLRFGMDKIQKDIDDKLIALKKYNPQFDRSLTTEFRVI